MFVWSFLALRLALCDLERVRDLAQGRHDAQSPEDRGDRGGQAAHLRGVDAGLDRLFRG